MTPPRRFASPPKGASLATRQSRFGGDLGWLSQHPK
jgi:hypothetical protein